MSKHHLRKFVAPGGGGFLVVPHGKRRGISNGRKRALELFAAQKGKCWLCGQRMTKKPGEPNTVTVDHVTPLSRGGTHSKKNLKGACAFCNKNRGNIMPQEYFAACAA